MINITTEQLEEIRDDFVNSRKGITGVFISSTIEGMFVDVSRINGESHYKIVEEKDMTLDDGATVAVSEQEIEAHVYLLWELGKSIQEICDALYMTESELRERPRINELLNRKQK